ncbi:type III pantothenate kinase [Candidatus Fermentibacteria bacterium]|nr:type III pantothenate kinase [Candidatus Fermentibacteria bacterium]
MRRLVLDIGNTKTAVGWYDDRKLVRSWRLRTRHWTSDDLGSALHVLLSSFGLAGPASVGFACVVPRLRHVVYLASVEWLSAEPLEVTFSTAGLIIEYPTPEELGADRISNAVAAVSMGCKPAIVADFGTATTFDVIDSSGAYLGGAIAPGVGTAAAELFRKAEKLSPVDLDLPERALGRSTSEAVKSGVLLGAAGAADRMTELLSEGLGGRPALLATGGWAPGLAPLCRSGFRVIPSLTLDGIAEVCRRNGK